jgi:methyl-accepting chemotaxis protein
MKSWFLNLSILKKILVIFFSIYFLFGILIFGFILPKFNSVMYIEKKLGLKHNIEMVYNLIVEYDERYKKGEFTLEETQKRAIARIKTMKYQEGKNYFWINDTHPKMIMHPSNPALNGKDLTDYKDPKGKNLFVEMAKVVKKDGEGTVDYQWKKVNSDEISEKISYIKLYEPWGWVIGTGIWVNDLSDDLKKELDLIYLETYIGILVLFILSTIIGNTFAKYLSRRLKIINEISDSIATGNLSLADKLFAQVNDNKK